MGKKFGMEDGTERGPLIHAIFGLEEGTKGTNAK